MTDGRKGLVPRPGLDGKLRNCTGEVIGRVKRRKPVPKFDSEDQEREFWAIHDTTDFFDPETMEPLPPMPNLKKTNEPNDAP